MLLSVRWYERVRRHYTITCGARGFHNFGPAILRTGDVYYEFAQKLVKAADSPPDDLKKLAKQACKANPDDCGLVEGQYKDAIYQFVTPVEDEAKKRWKDTLARASQLGVTNDYVKKARENLSKYLPDEFPFIKDERIGLEYP